jgi:hypothetical protein
VELTSAYVPSKKGVSRLTRNAASSSAARIRGLDLMIEIFKRLVEKVKPIMPEVNQRTGRRWSDD